MIFEPRYPVPCVTPLGDAYVWYIKTNGIVENDEVTVILKDSGEVRHMTTKQIKIFANETYEIKKKDETTQIPDKNQQ